jgi:hypothetical protein
MMSREIGSAKRVVFWAPGALRGLLKQQPEMVRASAGHQKS